MNKNLSMRNFHEVKILRGEINGGLATSAKFPVAEISTIINIRQIKDFFTFKYNKYAGLILL